MRIFSFVKIISFVFLILGSGFSAFAQTTYDDRFSTYSERGNNKTSWELITPAFFVYDNLKSEAEYKEIISSDPENHVTKLEYAKFLISVSRFSEAGDILTELIATGDDVDVGAVNRELLLCHIMLGNLEEALEVRKFFTSNAYGDYLDYILLANETIGFVPGHAREKIFQKAYELSPNDIDVIYYYGIFLKVRDSARSIKLFEKALELDPTFTNVTGHLFDLHAENGDVGRARHYIEMGMVQEIEESEGYYLTWIDRISQSKLSDVFEHPEKTGLYGKVLQVNPKNKSAIRHFIRRAESTGEIKQAAEFHKKLVSASGATDLSSETRNYLVFLYENRLDDEFINEFFDAISLQIFDAFDVDLLAYFLRGALFENKEVWNKLKDDGQLSENMNMLIENYPEHEMVKFLAAEHHYLVDPASPLVETLINDAISIDPSRWEFYTLRAMHYHAIGRDDDASADNKRAFELFDVDRFDDLNMDDYEKGILPISNYRYVASEKYRYLSNLSMYEEIDLPDDQKEDILFPPNLYMYELYGN